MLYSSSNVRDWIAENWSDDITLREWWVRMARSKMSFPSWPSEWHGGGAGHKESKTVADALDEARVIGPPTGLGILMGAPILFTRGNDDQRRRFLPMLADGTEGWCQLFSEPGAGSDLASLACRAERDGDEWVVNGQKVWTSGALHSRRGMLVARTDVDQPKHRGMTYFIIDMNQPGVEVRPIKQMNGKSHFNEVFFTDARVADADRIGEVNDGWSVTAATLSFERSGLSTHVTGGLKVSAGEEAGLLDRAVGEIVRETLDRHELPDEYGGLSSTLSELPTRLTAIQRMDMARLVMHESIARYTAQRIASDAGNGRSPGPESSTAKLWWTEGLRISRDLGMDLLGADGLLTSSDTPGGGTVQHFFLSMPSASIAGGSDEVQRNIIGERALGLPRDVQPDPSTPFRDIPRS
ncbi:MAG: acyl-CoA dehydrogenase family protein [Ilumatobacteraceae bacterium]